jgi:Rieske Fe-S protein
VTYERGKKILLCPCHAGVYDIEGNVVSGPPPKPLQKFSVRVEGENVVIG